MFLKLAFDFSIPEIRYAWRIGIISVVSYLLAIAVFHLQSPQWVMITSVVCSQVNLGSTMRKSKQRLVGTVLGCGLGLLTEYLFAQYTYLLVGLFFITFIIALQFIVRSYTIYSTFFTFAFILMMFFMPVTNYNIALLRIEDVVIGILIGTVGSFVLLPDFASKMFTSDVVVVVSELQGLFHTIIQWMGNQATLDAVMQQKWKSFNANQSARNRITEIYYEFGTFKYPVRKYEKFIISQERVHYILLLIVQSIRNEKESKPDDTSLHNFIKKMIEMRIHYSEIITKIPNIALKIKPVSEIPSIPLLVQNTQEVSEIDQKLIAYLDRLRFELKEMTLSVNEIIEYER